MEVYHGSFTTVENPHIIKGRYAKDFGVGFYCTQLKSRPNDGLGNTIRRGLMSIQGWSGACIVDDGR